MADVNPQPTLSTDGWVYGTKARLDVMFSDFLIAAYSQYPIAKVEQSLPYLIARYQDDFTGLGAATTSVLRAYLETKFNNVQVVCTVRPTPGSADFLTLVITGQITDENGLVYELNEVRQATGQRTVRFAEVNNGTLPYTQENV